MRVVLAVLAGGMVGAPLRYHLDRLVQERHASGFPWGTLTVNVFGSLVLGVLAAGSASHSLGPITYALLATGFCGALTTYSTFGFETLRLVEDGAFLPAAANVGANLLAGLGAAFLGFAVGGLVWPG
ncbi:fluoride efflux transporter CrcB [Actinopolymorpha rutila]|uniref:Fluoride-specific ion channel FluC n=1 Tax=Actinopolymorpha rutila TaxID=446787 RepID=A0A852ZBD5_9ACTN|nr:fluoride efflux transporter CrcB [Actinopolymorpha rutila]NYH90224.1 CrcB protein [Actinopolymorpha rutila]